MQSNSGLLKLGIRNILLDVMENVNPIKTLKNGINL